jgi:hypothetical protein
MEYTYKDTIKKPIFWVLLISLLSISYLINIGFDKWAPIIKMDLQKSLGLLFDIMCGVILMLFLIGSKLMLKLEQILGVFRFLFLLVLSFPLVVIFYIIIGNVLSLNLNNYSELFGSVSVTSFIIGVTRAFIKKRKSIK